MSTEEHRPLLEPHHNGTDEDPTNNPTNGSTAIQLNLNYSFNAGSRLYGTCNDDLATQEGIRYSWSNLNVYTTTTEKRPKAGKWPWNKFKKSSSSEEGPPPRKHILKDAYGVAYPGEILAIIGSSGAGKTTLLNALTFRSFASTVATGKRTLGGVPADRSKLASLAAYVQQDDMFIGSLTVREHLRFQALVRMDRHITYKRRMQRVDEVITELALTKCQHTIIGVPGRLKGISGGEMRRLSFASEVLTDPPLMLCDEPTSGLDSFMALNAISVLKGMASKGKTVVCTIHQPSSEVFAMFDKVLLVAEGRVAFLGSTADAFTFFSELGAVCPSNYNPADFFIQLLAVVPNREDSSRQAIHMVCDAFANSEKGRELLQIANGSRPSTPKSSSLTTPGTKAEEPWGETLTTEQTSRSSSPYKASWWAQFRAVLWRSVRSVMKEPTLIRVRTTQTLMVALMIVLIYYGQQLDQDGVMNINGVLFICLTNMTFQNIFTVVNVFSAEMPIFLREHLNGMYRTDVYFLSKTLAELPLFLFLPVLFLSVPYYLIGLNPDPIRFAFALLIIVLVANVATSFGYFISCISNNISTALAIGPPIVIPFMLFGGFFLNNDSVPSYLSWLSYLSWFKYGDEALVINQWSNIDEIACTRPNATCPKNGRIILESLSFKEENFWFDILALVGLIVVFRTMAFLSLLYKTYRPQ